MSRRSVRIFAGGGVLSGGLFGLMLAQFPLVTPNFPLIYAATCAVVLIGTALVPRKSP